MKKSGRDYHYKMSALIYKCRGIVPAGRHETSMTGSEAVLGVGKHSPPPRRHVVGTPPR